MANAAENLVDNDFPRDFLVPKAETGVLNFLRKYPQYNGRGVTIAIFDSGVDPKAAGLQTIPDGSVKVIERYDCSGCGDVDTTKTVKASADGTIVGLSGRQLKLTEAMKTTNINGDEYRVGQKSLFDLFTPKVRERLSADAKLKNWDPLQKSALADISRQLEAFDSKNSGNTQPLPIKEKLVKDNLENSTEFLQSSEKKFSEYRVTYDCVLYQTSSCWMAAIDIKGKGDLENAIHIGEYSKTHTIKSVEDILSISINVHDDGNVLELVGMCSSHGTHVASIASGSHPDRPEMDGVAPEAKIVSLTIGDGRLGSMETGTALVRAMIKVMELCNAGTKIDVINMSYGEHAHWSNSGRIGDLMNEVVNKYGVVWVASAGNHGPALCTIGTPPDISQPSCIGVGAYVSPDMMEAEYAMRQKLPGNVYTWTSRDPCIDGGQGVTVCAPGAAIASVPEFTMARQQLMNGTSMAAPHVAGAVALLISGLKQKGVDYSPFSIKRALWNTANKLSYVDPFAQGNGLLNVEKAFETLVDYAEHQETKLRFSVSVGANGGGAKGIHIRRSVLKLAEEFSVTIDPVFLNDKEVPADKKINFNIRLVLVPSASWVQCGTYLDLCYSARSVVVRVDPTGLPEGVHSASIRVYDSACPAKGTLFEIPITVVQPMTTEDPTKPIKFAEVPCKPNTILRHFVQVPNNATWAVLKMVVNDKQNQMDQKFLVHTVQLLPHSYCKTMETMKILPVIADNETVHAFKCEQNNIVEVCIAKYWSNFGETNLKYQLEFHGVRYNNNNIMLAANGIHRIDVTAYGMEDVSPSIQLKTAAMTLKPSDAKIVALSSRDQVPPSRQIYQNLISYNLHLAKAQDVALYCPLLGSVLYESEYESQLWMAFDANKLMVGCGDAYSQNSFVKLEKGDYTIKLQVRHERKELLEKINEAIMVAYLKLGNTLNLDVYKSYNNAVVGGKKIMPFGLIPNSSRPFYVAPITAERLGKSGIPPQCSWLEGAISCARDELGKKVDTQVFQYILVEGPQPKKSNGTKETKNKLDEYKEGLRDYQNGMIAKLDLDQAEELYSEIVAAHPKFVQAHLALIQKLDENDQKNQLPFLFKRDLHLNENEAALKVNLMRIISLADLVIKETDIVALLAYYGLKADNRPDAAKIKSAMDKQKSALLEAYVKKIIAQGKVFIMENKSESGADSTQSLDEFDNLFNDVGKFCDYNDSKILMISVWHAFLNQQYGRMGKYLLKIYDDKQQKEILEEMKLMALENNWPHVAKAFSKTIVSANPASVRLF